MRLHKDYYGKGPTKAKTFLVDDTVVCILGGGFTAVERTLIESGREQVVRDIREAFQRAMDERFTAVIEEALGRRVVAYMSQMHVDPDVAVEVFLLQPGVDEQGVGIGEYEPA